MPRIALLSIIRQQLSFLPPYSVCVCVLFSVRSVFLCHSGVLTFACSGVDEFRFVKWLLRFMLRIVIFKERSLDSTGSASKSQKKKKVGVQKLGMIHLFTSVGEISGYEQDLGWCLCWCTVFILRCQDWKQSAFYPVSQVSPFPPGTHFSLSRF